MGLPGLWYGGAKDDVCAGDWPGGAGEAESAGGAYVTKSWAPRLRRKTFIMT